MELNNMMVDIARTLEMILFYFNFVQDDLNSAHDARCLV